jgi:hypothetical protein
MCAQEDTENRRFNDNVALSRGIKEFIAPAASQQMRIEHHNSLDQNYRRSVWLSRAARQVQRTNAIQAASYSLMCDTKK